MSRIHEARFIAGASEPERLPAPRWPEIAFAGRSNAGKSSLLNRLVGRHSLARVSKTPGRTQQINFFLLDDRLVFADLPGYGFAKVPLEVKERWKALVESYLIDRGALRAVVLIVDSRRGLLQDDLELIEFLGAQEIPTIIAATKLDKLGRGERAKSIAAMERAGIVARAVIATSATSGEGIAELWREIDRVAGDRSAR